MGVQALKTIADRGILPVINIADERWAEPLADALCRGGIPALEVTLRSPGALNAIKRIRQHFPQMSIGAGTVLKKQQADDAAAAGADYLGSPGFSAELVRYCQRIGMPIIPGCTGAGEIQAALDCGLAGKTGNPHFML